MTLAAHETETSPPPADRRQHPPEARNAWISLVSWMTRFAVSECPRAAARCAQMLRYLAESGATPDSDLSALADVWDDKADPGHGALPDDGPEPHAVLASLLIVLSRQAAAPSPEGVQLIARELGFLAGPGGTGLDPLLRRCVVRIEEQWRARAYFAALEAVTSMPH